MVIGAIPPCLVSVPGPSLVQVIAPIAGTLAGAAVGAIVAFRTKSLDYARSDRAVRLQLVAMLQLSELELVDAANAATTAEPVPARSALAKTIDRAFSSDAAIALAGQASAVYNSLTTAAEASRTFDRLVDRLADARTKVLADLPSDAQERLHHIGLRRTALAELAKEMRTAARDGATALSSARRALGVAAPLARSVAEAAVNDGAAAGS